MARIVAILFVLGMNISQKEPIKSVELSYQTRGMRQFLYITPDSVVVTINEKVQYYKTTPTQWKKIVKTLKIIDFKGISSLKRPSKRSAFDGAMSGQLTVNTVKKKYESSNFDHNRPNVVLEKTIEAMKMTLVKTDHKDDF